MPLSYISFLCLHVRQIGSNMHSAKLILSFLCTVFLTLGDVEAQIVCAPGVVDKFPYPYACDKYYQCYDTIATTLDCPVGLWFDSRVKDCVNPVDSDCPLTTPTPAPTPTPGDLCWGVPPGYIQLRPDPANCANYIECIGDNARLLSCPPGLLFDPDREMCRDPFFVDCGGVIPTPVPTVTPDPSWDDPRCVGIIRPPQYFPEIDCHYYVECYDNHGHLRVCPSYTFFDPITGKCVTPSASSCGKTPSPTAPTRATGWTNDPDCPADSVSEYLFPYPGDCTKYYECWYGEKELRDCPPGLWFNPTLLVCDYPYHSGCY